MKKAVVGVGEVCKGTGRIFFKSLPEKEQKDFAQSLKPNEIEEAKKLYELTCGSWNSFKNALKKWGSKEVVEKLEEAEKISAERRAIAVQQKAEAKERVKTLIASTKVEEVVEESKKIAFFKKAEKLVNNENFGLSDADAEKFITYIRRAIEFLKAEEEVKEVEAELKQAQREEARAKERTARKLEKVEELKKKLNIK